MLQVSTGGSNASGAKVFLIEKDGNAVSWRARADGDNVTASKMWNSVLRLCRDQFGRKLKIKDTPITYHPTRMYFLSMTRKWTIINKKNH